jgi:branched-chain amino acid transport system permease protein
MSRHLAVAAALLVALLLAPFVLTGYALAVLTLVAIYAVAALAQNLLSGYANIPALGNVVFFAVSSYTCGSLIVIAHAPSAVSIAVGVLAAGAVGLLVGLPALRISGMHLAVVSVASVFVAQELMTGWAAGHDQIAASVPASQPTWLLQERPLYIVSTLVAATAFLIIWNLLHARSGRALLAISVSPPAAAASGIPVTHYRLASFVVSGLLTGVAGIVYLYYSQHVTPAFFSLDLSLALLTMIVVGGSRSLLGSLLGASIIGLLPQALKLFPSDVHGLSLSNSEPAIWAVMLLVTLWLFPEGLANALLNRAFFSPDVLMEGEPESG